MDVTDAEVRKDIREKLDRYGLVEDLMTIVCRELEAAVGSQLTRPR